MKILYGVVGDGMGHAVRSQVIIQQLINWGHQVEIIVSGRAFKYLEEKFEGVNNIWGLQLMYKGNELDIRKTVTESVMGAIKGWPYNIRKYYELKNRFKPDCIISDFEGWTAYYGARNRIPVIAIDNIQVISRCLHPPEILKGRKTASFISKGVIRCKVPKAKYYLVTTFFDAKIKKNNTIIVPPVLRQTIIEKVTTKKDHILVYQTSENFNQLPEMLKNFDVPFKIYGLKRNIAEPVIDKNLTFCPFSEQQFIEDLASCRGLIASSGFTLISEAVYLGKPCLATPVKDQFEQIITARYLEYLGYGLQTESLDKPSIAKFLENIDKYEKNLENYKKRDNSELFGHLKFLLSEIGNNHS
jgi:uncharacterized protein (TIGR00661 family)